MKKLLLIAALLGMGVAHAEYLNWMVGGNPVTTPFGDVSWTSATLFQNGTELNTWSSDIFDVSGYVSIKLNDGWDSASYLVELYQGDSTKSVAWSNPFFGSDIAGNVYLDNSLVPPGYNKFTPDFVPEPTSGMLFLLGGMLLGLKRRRQA